MKAKPSAGPWEVNLEQDDVAFINSGEKELCSIEIKGTRKEQRECAANAILMSHAHTMYEILKRYHKEKIVKGTDHMGLGTFLSTVKDEMELA